MLLFLSPDLQREHYYAWYLVTLFFNSFHAVFFHLHGLLFFLNVVHDSSTSLWFLQQFLLLNLIFFWHTCHNVRSQLILHHEVQMTPRCWPLGSSFVFPGLSDTLLAFSISPPAYIFSLYMASVYRISPKESHLCVTYSM